MEKDCLKRISVLTLERWYCKKFHELYNWFESFLFQVQPEVRYLQNKVSDNTIGIPRYLKI